MNLTLKSSDKAKLKYLKSLSDDDLDSLADKFEEETGKTLKSRDYNKPEEEMHSDIIEKLMSKDIRELILAIEAVDDENSPFEFAEEMINLDLENPETIKKLNNDFEVTRSCSKAKIIKGLSLESKSDVIEVTKKLIKINQSRYKRFEVNGMLHNELIKQLNSVDRDDLIKAIDNSSVSYLFSAPDDFEDCKCVYDLIDYVDTFFSDSTIAKIKKALKANGISLRSQGECDSFGDIAKEIANQIIFEDFKNIIMKYGLKEDYA